MDSDYGLNFRITQSITSLIMINSRVTAVKKIITAARVKLSLGHNNFGRVIVIDFLIGQKQQKPCPTRTSSLT